jgi:septum formation protein
VTSDHGRAAVRLVLASASPARLATLRRAGFAPEVLVSGVNEDGVDAGSPAATALELARRKADAVAAREEGAIVLGCDSVFELDGQAYGKAGSAGAATERWLRMRGRTGVLHTGHVLIDTRPREEMSHEPVQPRRAEATASTLVRFADLSAAEIDAYVATGEPLGVAGAFTVDGLGGPFVEGIEGDHHNVVGVSLPLLRRLLGELGLSVMALWSRGDR